MELYDIILKTSKALALENGLHTLNIRLVAKECNISIGSIYNYFPSKNDLIIATVESIWQDIFKLDDNNLYFNDFISCIKWVFKAIYDSAKIYPNFFSSHSLAISNTQKDKGIKIMDSFIINIKKILLQTLNNDKNIRQNVFNEDLTDDIFIDYIFSLILQSISKNKGYKPLLKFIENTIY